MTNGILIRYGDLTLKGKNQKLFIKAVNDSIKEKLSGLSIQYDFNHDRVYIFFDSEIKGEVEKRLMYVTGIYSYSTITKCSRDLNDLVANSVALIESETNKQRTTFKVETKRADKSFPQTSLEFTQEISKHILRNTDFLVVDVHHPQITLNIEIRKDACYLFIGQKKALGGFPIPTGGKAVVLLSGGIDSPVATFLAMKKGLQVECIHFESTPLTPIESVDKITDLVSVLANYGLNSQIKVHFVPFTAIHEQIIMHIPEEYSITIMRRMMVRIATKIMEKTKAKAIITGDSIGQVASQTLDSMNCIQSVTNALMIRPLASYDKLDIMKVAREIGTLDISIRPFQDCCSVYTPKNPSIHPQINYAKSLETKFDYEKMIEETVAQTKAVFIHGNEQIHYSKEGFILSNILSEKEKENE